MAIVIKRPTANVNTLWNVNSYTNINEIVEFNSTYSRTTWTPFGSGEPNDLFIEAYKELDVGDEQQYSMGTAGINNANMTQIILYIFGTRAGNESGISTPIDARVKIGDTWTSVISLNNTATEPTINWQQYTFTGSWSVSSNTPITLGLTFPVPPNPQFNISRTNFGVVYLGLDTGTYITDTSTPLVLDGAPEIKRSYFLYEGITQIIISSSGILRRGYKFEAIGSVSFNDSAYVRHGYKPTATGGINIVGACRIGRNYLIREPSIHVDENKKLWAWWNLDFDNGFLAEDVQKNSFLFDNIGSNGSLTNMTLSNWSLDVPVPLQKIKGKLFYPDFNKYSLDFNNSNPSSPSPQYVSFNETNQSNILKVGVNDFSITCWIKVNPTQNNLVSGIVIKINNDDLENAKGFGIGLIEGSVIGQGSGDYYLLATVNFDNIDNVLAVGTIVNDNQWHHISFVKNTTNLILYTDGQLNGLFPTNNHTAYSLNNTLSPDNDTVNLRFGQFPNINFDSNTNFIGKIDDVRFYKKAISAKEANELWMHGETTTASYGIKSVFYIASLNSTNISGSCISGRGIRPIISIIGSGISIPGRLIYGVGTLSIEGLAICTVKNRKVVSTIGINLNGECFITQRNIKPIVLINISGMGYIKSRSITSLIKINISGESIAYKNTGSSKTHIAEGAISTNGTSLQKLNMRFVSGIDLAGGSCQTSNNIDTGNADWNNVNGLVDQIDLAFLSDFGHFTNKLSDRLEGTNFGFNIEEKGIIRGIKFLVYIMFGATDPIDELSMFKFSEINPIVNGTRYFINKASNRNIKIYNPNLGIEQLGNFIYEFGGNNDIWGIPATVNNINSSDFGFSVQVSYSTSFSTGIFIGALTYACVIYYTIPIKVSGNALILSRTINESVKINITGTAICRVNRIYNLNNNNDIISGESIVRLPLPARHYANGTIKVSGSYFIHWPIKTKGNIHTIATGEAITIYQFVIIGSKKFVSWSDDFNRNDNLDIG